jgi:Undecaprenyl-phosphate glucose phosphotransferase
VPYLFTLEEQNWAKFVRSFDHVVTHKILGCVAKRTHASFARLGRATLDWDSPAVEVTMPPQIDAALPANVSDVQSSFGAQRVQFQHIASLYGLCEILAVCLAASAAAYVYWRHTFNWVPNLSEIIAASALIALAGGAIELYAGRINLSLSPGPAFLLSGIRTTLKAFAILVVTFFILKISDRYSRGTLVIQFGAVTMTILVMRALFQKLLQVMLVKLRLETDRIVVVGSLAKDRSFLGRLVSNGARVVFAQTLESEAVSRRPSEFVKEIVEVCRKRAVNQVVVAPSEENGDVARQIVEALAETPVTVHVVPPGVQSPLFQTTSAGICCMPAAVVNNRPLTTFNLTLKRGFDIAVSLLSLIVLAPILGVVAVAIWVESDGPVFFRQTRHGYGNRGIRVFKFRSMHVLEDGKAFRQATRNDPRITHVGRFIRSTNIDELPQLFNVLIGEMSIVGPRPHPVALNESFSDRIKWFNRRHNIRPGITGWAQINGYRGETETLEKMAGRVGHDLWYLENWSFFLDLKIILLTVFSPSAYSGAR